MSYGEMLTLYIIVMNLQLPHLPIVYYRAWLQFKDCHSVANYV